LGAIAHSACNREENFAGFGSPKKRGVRRAYNEVKESLQEAGLTASWRFASCPKSKPKRAVLSWGGTYTWYRATSPNFARGKVGVYGIEIQFDGQTSLSSTQMKPS